MLRKEVVYDGLKRFTSSITLKKIRDGYNGVSTAELSEVLELDRSNCSRELNTLFVEGQVVKVLGKPVRFFPTEHLESLIYSKVLVHEGNSLRKIIEASVKKLSDFDTVIGANGSLNIAINQAKAAMIYPPFGLHTLITGETGIGKTMFVELMYRYAKEFGVLDNNAELIVFNCAEYADNPQLLVSELFGYAKGSFTGAESDKPGLIARADKGILFLDEIHRLPPEGQEMLFQLMDSGKYRRLGDSTQELKADVLIIGATTESVESNLLLTFVRRIPMLITLPNLEQRPLREHLDLINLFFEMEQKKINRDIKVNKRVMESLLRYRYPGNIGQLKTDIQLICARAFLDSMKDKLGYLSVHHEYLPQYLLENAYGSSEQHISVDTLLKSYEEHILFDGTDSTRRIIEETDAYKNIDESMDINEVKEYIQQMILGSYENRSGLNQSPEEIFKIIKPDLYYSVVDALSIAQSRLKCGFQKQTYVAFALHVQSTIERGLEAKLFYDVSEDIKVQHPQEYQAAKLVMSYLSDVLKYDFAPEEALLATLFLTTNHEKHEEQIALMVIAHGNGVAKNTAHVANTLFETDHAVALDMSLDESVDSFYERFVEKAQFINQGKGVLIIADMGSLVEFGDRFTESTGIPTATINFLSTPIVLESLRKVLFSASTLDAVKKEINESIVSMIMDQPESESFDEKKLEPKKSKAIIVTCITGEGAAIALKHYIQDSLPPVNHMNINFITTNKEKFDIKNIEEFEIVAVVGAVDLKIDNVPYINTEEVLLGNGLKTLFFLLTRSNNLRQSFSTQKVDTMQRILTETLSYLNPEKTLTLVMDAFTKISESHDIQEFQRLNINFCLHVPSVIERVIRSEAISYKGVEERMNKDENLTKILKDALKGIEETYRIEIPDPEICYILDIFDTF